MNDTAYRRLDPEYYAWLRARISLAQLAAKAGRLDETAFEEMRVRFNEIHGWAVHKFGEQPLLDALRALDARTYEPPALERVAAIRASRLPVAEDAANLSANVAAVDAIRERALALGWTVERLGVGGGQCVPRADSLVRLLQTGSRIGQVTRQSIEIIGHPPAEVRRRFYSPDIEQPWVRRHDGLSL